MRYLAILSLLVLSAGCASAPKTYYDDQAKSQALRIALSTGLTDPKHGPLFDLPRAELPDELKHVPDRRFNDVLELGAFSLMGADVVTRTALSGWSMGGGRGFDLTFVALGFLIHSPTRPHPATAPQVIAWMPACPKQSGKAERQARAAARKEFAAMMNAALLEALPEEITVVRTIDAHWTEVTGPESCVTPDDGRTCMARSIPYDPIRSLSPDGTDAWRWANWPNGAKEHERTGTATAPAVVVARKGYKNWYLPVSEDRGFIGRVSAGLPEWVWIYLPPREGEPAVMFNQGVAHLFIEPLADERTAATH